MQNQFIPLCSRILISGLYRSLDRRSVSYSAIQLVSHNLPVGMKLIVKECPWSIGKRPINYYRKLIKIPNVMLAYSRLKSKEIISDAKIVTIIAGCIYIEALMLKKPVAALVRIPFQLLLIMLCICLENINQSISLYLK